jgi:hypothetical protein
LETSNDTGPAATCICSGVQPESTSVTATFLAPVGAFELVPHPATPAAVTAQAQSAVALDGTFIVN